MKFKSLKDTEFFTIKSYEGKLWKEWNAEAKKMNVSNEYIEGYSPKYQFMVEVDTSGQDYQLDLSKDQLGQILVAAFEVGKPLSGLSFKVKTNGKTGLEIRYYLNLTNVALHTSKAPVKPISGPTEAKEITLDQIPF